MFKTCFKCQRRKTVNNFYKHEQMADGLLGKCISCAKKDAHARYDDPEARKRIRIYEAARNKTAARKEQKRKYQRRMRRGNPGKARARIAVGNAVRDGRLTRLPCEVCGNLKSEAHHDDYRKILDVRWLCFKHHREAHGQIVGIQ